jgi:hypothetical protein
MTNGPVADALSLLKEQRRVLTEEAQRIADETRRVDEAIQALEGAPLTSRAAASATPPRSQRPSVRAAALELMESADRDWSVAELLAAFAEAGTPLTAEDRENALRAALSVLHRKEEKIAAAGPRGRYIATKWQSGTAARSPESSNNAH